MMKRLEPFIFASCLTLGLISYFLIYPNLDSDILWSIAIGKWISLNETFPVVDSFSWTIYGKEWLTHEWLFSYLAYHLDEAFGAGGLYILAGVPVLITIYVLYIICKKFDKFKSYAFIISLTIGTSLLYKSALPFRAYIYGLMFFTILIYLLYSKKESKVDWLYFVLLFSLWANFHISVCMGVIIFVIENIRKSLVDKNIKQAGWIVTAGIMATLINPYGYKIWTYFGFTLTGMGESKSIAEWQAADFNDPMTLFVFVFLASIVIMLQVNNMRDIQQGGKNEGLVEKGCNNFTDRKIKMKITALYDCFTDLITARTCLLFLFWGFYIYSLYSIRMIFYAVVMWIIVTALFAGKLSHVNFTKRTYYFFAGLFLLWFVGNIGLSGLRAPNITEYDKSISPVEEVQFLKENPIYQQNLFNEYLYGGYLIHNDIPVFIDARSDSYIKFGIQQKYGDIVLLRKDPQKLLDEMKVKNILIPNYSALDRYISVNQNWMLIHRGPTASVFTVSN